MEDVDCMLTIKSTIDGIWVNNNKDTKNATKVIISNNGKHVQIFDKYNRKYYDKGTHVLIPECYTANMYWTIFNSSIVKSTFIFTIDNNDMEIRYEQDYKSTSETKRFVENFTKLNPSIIEPIVIPMPLETKMSLAIEANDTAIQILDNAPILLCDDLYTDDDIENPYENANTKMEISTIKDLRSGFFYYLPTNNNLQFDKDKSYGLFKRGLNVSIFFKNFLNRIRNTVSMRRLISLTDMIT
ncbi:hypothetical protein Q4Q34_18500 [Flavivirga abyssicola]|uniref:hypothetical protein n=1 Tax=Flavivirga abyssicola TaxID=3063533 RepID=UPI0026E03182|nr:hypothetical protein [Flavivirga sp. MEBiC07777]WVK13207.1 hypothetical protein Q4Q34_18500 [Flavivirga sp. MEBiC07777]